MLLLEVSGSPSWAITSSWVSQTRLTVLNTREAALIARRVEALGLLP